jgi:hypothetical protein
VLDVVAVGVLVAVVVVVAVAVVVVVVVAVVCGVVEVEVEVVDAAGCCWFADPVCPECPPVPAGGFWPPWSEPVGLLDFVGSEPPLWLRAPVWPEAAKATRSVAVPPEPVAASATWTLTLYTPAEKVWVGPSALEL